MILRAIKVQDEDLSSNDLTQIESLRKVLNAKVREFSQTDILQSLAGTITPILLTSIQAWSIFFEYALIRALLRYKVIHLGPDLPGISTIITSIIGGFMSFFLVFFVSQAYARFINQFDTSMRVKGRILNLCFFARTALPPAEALRLMRYANAVHVIFYIGLSNAYSYQNLFVPLNERYNLLTEKEVKRITQIGMKNRITCTLEGLTWMFDLIYKNYRKGNRNRSDDHNDDDGDSKHADDESENSDNRKDDAPLMDDNTLQMMISEVLQMRGAISDLFHCADQSIPFSYMHLLVLINGGYLIIMAYAIATYFPVSDSIFPDMLGSFMLISNIIFVIGMKEIGRQMIDPYGSEAEDLAVPSFLEATLRASRLILNGHRFADAESEKEQRLDFLRPPLGNGYEATTLAYAITQPESFELPNYDMDTTVPVPPPPLKEVAHAPPSPVFKVPDRVHRKSVFDRRHSQIAAFPENGIPV